MLKHGTDELHKGGHGRGLELAHHFLRLHAFAFGRLVAWNTICRDMPSSLSSLFLLSNSCILICSVSPPSSTSRDRDRDATLVASDSTPAGAGSRDSRGRPAESRGSRGFHTERGGRAIATTYREGTVTVPVSVPPTVRWFICRDASRSGEVGH